MRGITVTWRCCNRLRSPVMDVSWREERESAVAMLRVIPSKEDTAKGTRLGELGKCRRKLGLILGGLEERLDVRVIVADVRSRMALGHAQSASRNATGLEVIELPRSACTVSLRGIDALPWQMVSREQHARQR